MPSFVGAGYIRPKAYYAITMFLFGGVPRGVEDAAPYKRKMKFFDTLRAALRGGPLFYSKTSGTSSGSVT